MARVLIIIVLGATAFWAGSKYYSPLQSKLEQARRSSFEHDYEKADALYEEILGRSSAFWFKGPHIYELVATALYERAELNDVMLSQTHRAIELYDALLERFPKHEKVPQALIRTAKLYEQRLNDVEEASTVYQYLLKYYRDSTQSKTALAWLARLAMKQGSIEQARQFLKEIEGRWPNTASAFDARLGRARTYALEPESAGLSKAIQLLSESLQNTALKESERAILLAELGHYEKTRGNFSEAHRAYESALKHHPQPHVVQSAIKRVLEMEGEYHFDDSLHIRTYTRRPRKTKSTGSIPEDSSGDLDVHSDSETDSDSPSPQNAQASPSTALTAPSAIIDSSDSEPATHFEHDAME